MVNERMVNYLTENDIFFLQLAAVKYNEAKFRNINFRFGPFMPL